MKRKLVLFFTLILTISLIIFSNTGIVTASQDSENDIKLAQEKATNRIERMTGLTHPHWKEAVAVNPISYCDLEGRVICYVFSVEKDKKAIGYIIIGSKLYLNSFFEAGDGPGPQLLTRQEAQEIIDKQVDATSKSKYKIKECFNFYSGGFNDFYTVYDVNGKKLAINLYSHDIYTFNELKFGLLPPDEYAEAKSALKGTKSAGYDFFSMGLYDSYDDCTSPSTGCGPASGVMIATYYRSLGYSNFPIWYDYPNDGYLDDAYEELYDTMDTGAIGTTVSNFSSGFDEYAANHGYSAFFTGVYFNYGLDAYWTTTAYINANTPVGARCVWFVGGHWYVIHGYSYYTDYEEYDFICNSSGGGSLNGGASNVYVGFYEKSWDGFVAVID